MDDKTRSGWLGLTCLLAAAAVLVAGKLSKVDSADLEVIVAVLGMAGIWKLL